MAFVSGALAFIALIMFGGVWLAPGADHTLFIFFGVAALWINVLYIRSTVVGAVRTDMMFDPQLDHAQRLKVCDSLPDYVTMMFSPRHYFRWTRSQWTRYSDKRLRK